MNMPEKMEDPRIADAIKTILGFAEDLTPGERRKLLAGLAFSDDEPFKLAQHLLFFTAPGDTLEKVVTGEHKFGTVFKGFMKEIRGGLWENPKKT